MYRVKDKWGNIHATTEKRSEAELWIMKQVDKECKELMLNPTGQWEYNRYHIVKVVRGKQA